MGIFARWARPKGRLPDDLRSQLAAEGILLIEEGVPADIAYRHYRAPGRRGTAKPWMVSIGVTAPASLNSTEGLSGRPAASKTLDH